MVTYLFFFSFPKCNFGQSAYYSNILLCIFCILNASPDVISWSHLLCTEEELAPACVAGIAVQGREMINPQPMLAIPGECPLFPATSLVERQRVINQVLPMALGLSPFLPLLAWCGWAAAGRDTEEQEDAAAAASIIFVTIHLFRTVPGGLCIANAPLSWFACSPSSGTSRCSSRSCIDQTYPLIITH